MTVSLPISIHVCDDLIAQFAKITSVSNKLEAQLNFQTMTADWYGDEAHIVLVRLCLETPDSFLLTQQETQQTKQQSMQFHMYSDDAFSYQAYDAKQQILICHIAITESELVLLTQQNKIIAALLRVKLQKVLNLIAKQLQLPPILP
ncbi:hypothetical protein NBRC116592_21840 [Colwellia sp. KU-HH00111]|uniref:hypothetical protein n=1 Tax=Colwellia sp. KU-HH00111 TaxID=3127652 RepID=UPI003103401E